MRILGALFGRPTEIKPEPETKLMRCLTPFIQQNQDNPDFFIDFKKIRSDGSMNVERLYPSSGKTEILIVSADGSIEDSDVQTQ